MKLDLSALAPRFRIRARSVEILTSPEQFYTHLKESISTAKQRVFLATLYIGASQRELVDVLDKRLSQNQDLKVHILSDGLRGTREAPKNPSSASLLSPLVQRYPNQVTISMYRTPAFRGLLSKILPRRLNEGAGLQHMKLYGVDDQITLSGANLSTDYFTDRQDRYICIKNKEVTDYYFDLYKKVEQLSYRVEHKLGQGADNFKLTWPWPAPCPQQDPKGYKAFATELLSSLVQPSSTSEELDDDSCDVYPIVQLTPLGVGNDFKVMKTLCEAAKRFPWTLTAGYFNIARPLQAELLESTTKGTVIIAGEKANGFYKSKGISRHVPELYSLLAKKFAEEATQHHSPLRLLEWQHGVVHTPGGWSYHAKGMWLGDPIFATVVGSSNFTRRAYQHDLEAGAVLITKNPQLQAAFRDEVANLEAHARPVSSDNFAPPRRLHKAFVWLFGDRL